MKKAFTILIITAAAGKLFGLTINPPILVSPADSSLNLPINNVLLDWNYVPNVNYYYYEVDTVSTFTSPWMISGTNAFIGNANGFSDTEHNLTNLPYGKRIYWHVRVFDGNNYSGWSWTWWFTTIPDPNGISENELLRGLSVSPNPATSVLNFTLKAKAEVKLYDITGQRIGEWILEEGRNKIDVSALPRGIYFVGIKIGTAKKTVRIVLTEI